MHMCPHKYVYIHLCKCTYTSPIQYTNTNQFSLGLSSYPLPLSICALEMKLPAHALWRTHPTCAPIQSQHVLMQLTCIACRSCIYKLAKFKSLTMACAVLGEHQHNDKHLCHSTLKCPAKEVAFCLLVSALSCYKQASSGALLSATLFLLMLVITISLSE